MLCSDTRVLWALGGATISPVLKLERDIVPHRFVWSERKYSAHARDASQKGPFIPSYGCPRIYREISETARWDSRL